MWLLGRQNKKHAVIPKIGVTGSQLRTDPHPGEAIVMEKGIAMEIGIALQTETAMEIEEGDRNDPLVSKKNPLNGRNYKFSLDLILTPLLVQLLPLRTNPIPLEPRGREMN